MKTFKEWMKSYYIRHGFISSNPELEAAWNASAENSAEEIAKRDERIAEIESRLNEVALNWQMLAAQNQQLRDLLNHFRDDVLFRIGINSPYRTDVAAPYYERIKKTLATFKS